MQRIFNSLLGLTLAVMVIFSTGCGEDDGGGGSGPGTLSPTIFLASGVDLVSTDASVPFADGSFSVQIDLNDGDNPLNTLTITEGGTTIPASNLVFDGGATTPQNPFLILGADQSGTVYEVEITPANLMPNETRFYEFTVTDSEGLSDVTSVNVTFTATAPTVSITGPATVSTSAGGFTISVDATETDFSIDQIAFYEDGVLLNPDSVIVLSGFNDPLTTNPETITATAGAYSQMFEIRPSAANDGDVRTYTVDVSDDQGTVGTSSIAVTFTTPQVDVLAGVIFNADGPNGGGLDLDSDDSGTNNVSRDSPLAEIRDEGIDLSLPNDQNWIQRISAVNGANLRTVNPADVSDTWNFDNVTSYGEVIAAYDAGVAVVDQSEVITGGEIFAIERDGNYYLVRVESVTVTPADNLDSYTLTVINEAQ